MTYKKRNNAPEVENCPKKEVSSQVSTEKQRNLIKTITLQQETSLDTLKSTMFHLILIHEDKTVLRRVSGGVPG